MAKKTSRLSDEEQAVENLQVIIDARSLKNANSDRITLRNWKTRLGTARETTTASDHARLTALLLDAIDALLGHEAKAEDCTKLFKALRSSPALIRRLIDIQTGEHTAQLKTYLRMSTENAEKEASSEKEKKMPPSRRERPGFIAPSRVGKVSLQGFVDLELRIKFNELASVAGLSANELLICVLEGAVKRGLSPEAKAEITAHTRKLEAVQRKAEAAQRNVLTHIFAPKKTHAL